MALPQGVFLPDRQRNPVEYRRCAPAFPLSDSTPHKFGKRGPGEICQLANQPEHAVRRSKLADRLYELPMGFAPLPEYYQRQVK
ncbi:hypothetical protein DFR29_103187 [Tahibacter aquaticus]|uniref:Uncharacterized protein n=1 Tax=Tahibacter aquaticus TaxID=520092 RepID=A0A4R6Z4S0_9GAMM|nr:hypothetical protein [Tahibacter aquaticus]TDR46651.1 hypothetical protein DFR29_103187 [Tahibacter aquaticus]